MKRKQRPPACGHPPAARHRLPARRLRLAAAVLLLFLLGACSPEPENQSPDRSGGLAAIISRLTASGRQQGPSGELTAQLEAHVRTLASDALSGRLVGSEGIALAERYIAETFKNYGLTPLPGQAGYYLDFDLYSRGYDPEKTTLSARVDGREVTAMAGTDFRPFPFSALDERSGQLVFAGYGITAPEYGYDDYEGLEVEGRFVLVLRHEPPSDPGDDYFQGAELTRHSLFVNKARNAGQREAVGLLLVSGPDSHLGAEDLRLEPSFGLNAAADRGSGAQRQDILAAHVSRDFAGALLEPSGLSLEELQESLAETARPGVFNSSSVTVRMSVSMHEAGKKVAARNLAGFIQGADPELRDEWIVIGAHHDHLGSFSGEGDTVFNGADDNASGVAAVLALAGLLSRAEPPPRRSLAFVTFSAEEQGLLGSRVFTNKQAELERVVLMINLDMIGRNPEQPLQIMGDAYVPQLRAVVEDANREIGLPLSFGGVRYSAASDHDPFFQQGIPFLFFFAGVHPDYHGTGDHADKLAYGRLADIVRLVQGTVAESASERSALESSVSVWWLGLTAQMSEQAEVPGVRAATITSVEEGSQAQKNGFRTGDRILAIDGSPVSGPSELRRRLNSVEPAQALSVRLLREGQEQELSLSRTPVGFLGVIIERPEEDWLKRNGLPADEGVLLSRVLPDGPAERAGLQAGDVITMVDNRPVSPANLSMELARLGAGTSVKLSLLRQAKRIEVELVLGRRP